MAQPKRMMAEDLLGRFRSKEDLYRYMTHQGKSSRLLLTFLQSRSSCRP
jgi:hypothetical protein